MKNRKVYIRLIITYVLVFSIPLFVNLFSLENIAESTRENICESVKSNLDNARELLESSLTEMDTIVDHLSANNMIREVAVLMDEDTKKTDISKILGVQEYLKTTMIPSIMEDYYVYFHKSKMIISQNYIFLNRETAADFFQYGDIPWTEWEAMMEENYSRYLFPERMTHVNRTTEPMILYAQSLVTDYGIRGTYLFPIRSSSVRSLLKDSDFSGDGWVYLMNKEGEILVSSASSSGEFEEVPAELFDDKGEIFETKLSGRTVEVIRSESSQRDLSFIAVLPKSSMDAQINAAQHVMILWIIGGVILGLIGIVFVSWHRGRKIDNILRVLSANETEGENSAKDEMLYISNSLQALIEKNTDLKEDLLRQYPVTRGLLLERLLRGMGNEQELEEYGISLNGKQMLVLVFKLLDKTEAEHEVSAEELVVYKQLLQQKLGHLLPGEKYLTETELGTGALLCAFSPDEIYEKEDLRKELTELAATFREMGGIQVRITVGQICDSLQGVGRSYDCAAELLQYGASGKESVLFFEDYSENRKVYFFPVSLEERLINAVTNGNQKGTHDQLKELYQINVMERNISPSMLHFLVNDLQCAVFKALHGLDNNVEIDDAMVHKELEDLNQENDILLRFHRINHIFEYICEKAGESSNADIERQKQEIKNYIEEHYSESDMGLVRISEEFGYSSSYFSKLFKDLFQENFASYLEQLRIEKVCELLKGNDTLETIAGKVGYNSAYVMRTAFKRSKGMTPNEYRKMI